MARLIKDGSNLLEVGINAPLKLWVGEPLAIDTQTLTERHTWIAVARDADSFLFCQLITPCLARQKRQPSRDCGLFLMPR